MKTIALQDIFSVIFVVMRRHFRLMTIAATKVMDEREFLEASSTMIHIAQAVRQRVDQLESKRSAIFH